jgi:hypothetical protein
MCLLWPRGTGFPQLLSMVTSTVDHVLWSPSPVLTSLPLHTTIYVQNNFPERPESLFLFMCIAHTMATEDRFLPAALHGDLHRIPYFRVSFYIADAIYNNVCAGQLP